MKKTIIINIGHSIIHIEEDAYEILRNYLQEIKQHFTKSADDFEIVTDIENRIAEMFAELLLARPIQVVTLEDVESVISQMGRVQDFQADEDEPDEQPYSSYSGVKKLFRDTDDGVIAGVCSGLGHYLSIEARWVRVIAFCSIFLGGAGILAYLILWIAVPNAVTRSEKMEMKGESTNLYGYKRNFEEELAAFKMRMKSANEQFEPMVKRSGNFITEIVSATGRALNALGRTIAKLAAGFIVVFGFAFLISLIVGLAAFLGFWDNDAYRYFPLSIINQDYRSTLAFSAFIIAFIPVLALVLFSIRVAFNKKSINKSLSFGLLVIWLAGVAVGVYYGAKITSEFKEHAELVQTTPVLPYPVYTIDADNGMVLSKADSIDYQIDKGGFQNRVIVDDSYDSPFRIPRNIHIEIEKSESGKPVMIQTFESQGRTFNIALQNAKNIDYKFTQQESRLIFSPSLLLKKGSNWRNQEVRITFKVPVGTRLLINNNLYQYFYSNLYGCDGEYKQGEMYNEWVMTDDGLKCKAELDKPAPNP